MRKEKVKERHVMQKRTNVQVLRRLHNQSPGDGAVQVELLMRGVEEADRVSGCGEGKQGCVAQAGACEGDLVGEMALWTECNYM